MAKNTVILTHAGADFDAISSAFAASKLYSNSVLIHPGSTDINAQKIISIFSDILNFKKVRDLPKDFVSNVSRVVLVDTKFMNRVGDGKEFLNIANAQIVIFDHHQGETDIKNAISITKNVGANTTILVNLLKLKKIKLSPVEATILALGIYEDTGSLSFPQVTTDDFKALEFLFSFGVDIKLIHRFMSPFLQNEQIELLKVLLDNLREYNVSYNRVGITHAVLPKYVPGISVLAHKIIEMIDLDIIFVLIQLENSVHIIGRSVSEVFNLTKISEIFGGGGHPTAISALVKNGSIKEIEEKIIQILSTENFPTLKAKDIMSSPVKMVDETTTIKDAFNLMVKMGYSGLPIEENGKVIGIIEKKNVEKAFLFGRKNSPVKQFYTSKIITVDMDENLREIENKMIMSDVGRVLVKHKDKIVGIISRSDLLKAYRYEELLKNKETEVSVSYIPDNDFVIQTLTNALPKEAFKIVKEIGSIARTLNIGIYLVGGAVRDAFLGKKVTDLDFVLPDAIKFGENLKEKFKGDIEIFKETQTVHFKYKGMNFDFATARREYYVENSLVPVVEKATLREDLERRDFTINAMAIDIRDENFGKLYDFFGGYEDLLKKTIKVLKPLSFVEDPSRIFRAIKYMVELDFKLDHDTEFLLKQAIELGVIRNSRSGRIQEELRELIQKDEIEKIIPLFISYNITEEIFRVKNLPKSTVSAIKKFYKDTTNPEERVLGFIFLVNLNKKNLVIEDISRILGVKKRVLEKMREATKQLKTLKKMLKKTEKEEIILMLNKIDTVFIKAFSYKANGVVKDFLKEYIEIFRNVKIETTGKDLVALGLKPGKQYKNIFETLTKMKIKGIIKNKDDELKYILSNREEFEWK